MTNESDYGLQQSGTKMNYNVVFQMGMLINDSQYLDTTSDGKITHSKQVCVYL